MHCQYVNRLPRPNIVGSHHFPETCLVGIAVLWIPLTGIIAVEWLRLFLRCFRLLLVLIVLIRDVSENLFFITVVVFRLVVERLQTYESLLQFAD